MVVGRYRHCPGRESAARHSHSCDMIPPSLAEASLTRDVQPRGFQRVERERGGNEQVVNAHKMPDAWAAEGP
jgi:hypothetical protein